MATFLLLPNATGVTSAHWVVSGESDRHLCLDDDNGNTSFVHCDNALAAMTIEYADPSVDEEDIDSIDSVRFISSGRSTDRTNPSVVSIKFEAPTAGFAESCSYDVHRTNYETINGTARTTSDGAHTWTYADLEALELECTKILTINVQLSYLAIEVTYTEAVTTVADNSTFFGANF